MSQTSNIARFLKPRAPSECARRTRHTHRLNAEESTHLRSMALQVQNAIIYRLVALTVRKPANIHVDYVDTGVDSRHYTYREKNLPRSEWSSKIVYTQRTALRVKKWSKVNRYVRYHHQHQHPSSPLHTRNVTEFRSIQQHTIFFFSSCCPKAAPPVVTSVGTVQYRGPRSSCRVTSPRRSRAAAFQTAQPLPGSSSIQLGVKCTW